MSYNALYKLHNNCHHFMTLTIVKFNTFFLVNVCYNNMVRIYSKKKTLIFSHVLY